MARAADTWMTATQAAEALGVSVSTVRQWANDGRLNCYRTRGGHRRFKSSDLEEYLGRAHENVPSRRRLHVLEQTTPAVSSRLDLDRLLSTIPRKVLGVIASAQGAMLLLYQRDLGRLVVQSSAGLDAKALGDLSLALGEGIAGKVLLSRRAIRLGRSKDIVDALADLQPTNKDALLRAAGGAKKGRAVLAVPLLYKDDALGVLLVVNIDGEKVFTDEDQSLLQVIASQVATAIENAKAFEQIKRMHLESLKILIKALNAKDYYSFGHAMRVSAYAELLGREMGLGDAMLVELAEAASLHDIGKIGMSDELLIKGSREAEDVESMRGHPILGASILSPLFTSEMLEGVRHHHEAWDGSGYPDGEKERDICEVARMLAVADFYDSVTVPRAFSRPLNYREARERLVYEAGRTLDPRLVDLFLRVLDKLERRRDTAREIAAQAATALNSVEHASLRAAADTASAAYDRGVAVLREVRDQHAEVRFLTTVAQDERGYYWVLDAEEDPATKSNLGDSLLEDGELPDWYAGEEPDRVVVSADDWGVWISGYAPLRDADGRIVAIADADLAVLDEQDEHPGALAALQQMMSKIGTRMASAEIQASSDGLTGLFNHRYFQERLQHAVDAAAMRHESLALLFCDLDDFKRLNDTYGHSTGDATLAQVARIIQNTIRAADLACRYGGDEFAVALCDTDLAAARRVAERIRHEVAAARIGDNGKAARTTVSIGIAVYPDDASSKEDLLEKADWTMYRAKAQGKDCLRTFVASATEHAYQNS